MVRSFKTQADEYLRKHTIYNALRLKEDLISIGTWGGGLVVINLKGEIHYIIDKEFGLQDLIIHDQKTDSAGNIWLALSKGVSRVEILSPTSLFSSQQGLQGTVESVTSFNGSIYAATSVGVFYLDKKIKILSGSKVSDPVFKPIDNLSIECWDLLAYKNENIEELLVIANDQISMINKNHQLKTLVKGVAYDMLQSKLDPARVYIGFEDGLGSLYYAGGKWKVEDRIDGINETISSISEDYLGNLWMGTLRQGVIRMNIKSFDNNNINDVELLKYDTLSGLPTGPILVSQISGRLVFGTSKGIYKILPL